MKMMNRLSAAALVALFALGTAGVPSSATAAPQAETKKKKSAKKKAPTVKAVNNAHCPVMTGSPIGSMGAGTTVTHKGYKVSLCCAGCTGKFKENPDAYLQAALADSKRQ